MQRYGLRYVITDVTGDWFVSFYLKHATFYTCHGFCLSFFCFNYIQCMYVCRYFVYEFRKRKSFERINFLFKILRVKTVSALTTATTASKIIFNLMVTLNIVFAYVSPAVNEARATCKWVNAKKNKFNLQTKKKINLTCGFINGYLNYTHVGAITNLNWNSFS